ncbi:hypothetical protein E3N88_16642 [Mikania micrantha]|uniref:Reverse transcriptase Ty1/copia-type domain-containing protein n=1 Tax=Mikania micrantha TaxID=192012 RepID=A0A5N6NZC9_9ASTR|nr:hypothetical protein E3N88_16642 [Mikania micrantha]
MTTIRLVLSIVATENLHLEQLDVKTTFFHGVLDEDIYMVQPEDFQISGKENMPDSPLYCDNQSAIHLGKNPVFHGKTKHIQQRYHFIRGLINDGTLMLEKIKGTKNPADSSQEYKPKIQDDNLDW